MSVGTLLAPQLVDQPVAGDRLVRPRQKEREDGALARASERAEDPELHQSERRARVDRGSRVASRLGAMNTPLRALGLSLGTALRI